MLVVLLCCQTFATAQALRDTPVTSVNGFPCCAAKGAPNVSILELSGQNAGVLPIPSSGLVHVDEIAYERYSVLDSRGEMWVAGPGTKDRTIDLGHLPTGIYYLHLSSKDGEVVRKVLKGK